MSMFTSFLLLRRPVRPRRRRPVDPAELDLHLAATQLGPAVPGPLPGRRRPAPRRRRRRATTRRGSAAPATGTSTSRPTVRRQCRGRVSGRSTPGEVTSSMYGVSPNSSVSCESSTAVTARLTAATSSSETPVSASTTTRTTVRRPAGLTDTFSRSHPASATAGAIAVASRSRWAAPDVIVGASSRMRPTSRG